MNDRAHAAIALLCAWIAFVATICLRADAATYYWDTNGSASGIGSAGGAAADWLSNSWATGPAGTLATSAWPNTQPTNDDGAMFIGTAGTVNLHADVYANELTFQTHAYTLASTGGALHLVGDDPTITVNLPGGNNTATISAPILGAAFTLGGNSLSGGLKFLVLANTSATDPNAFTGTLGIDAGGALRIGGGVAREQIPDDVDLDVAGVIDFVTSGGASDGKQEKVRNVTVAGTNANFSVGNEADFVVNSIAADANGSGQGIAINGNNGSALEPHAPGRLIINGWNDGAGHLTLNNGRVRINVTSSSFGVGGRVLLSGNLYSTGSSEIWNHNGGPTTPDDHVFTNKSLDFTSSAHTIDVSSGTLLMTSRYSGQPLDVTVTAVGGATLLKTGAGVWLYEHAVQSSFSGANRIEQGTLRIAATDRLSNAAALQVAGGTFDMQSFSEHVGDVVLESGSIAATGSATLIASSFDVRSGTAQPRFAGVANLMKTTAGTVTLNGNNSYSGTTTVSEGLLLVNGTHTGGTAYSVGDDGALGGGGTINAPIAIEGRLTPGTSIGTLTAGGNVTFGEGSHFAVELAGMMADKLVVNGDLDLSAPQNALDVVGAGTGGSWIIATYTGSLTGRFESVPIGYLVNYGTGTNSQLTLTEGLAGDYNDDGTVDAADYTVWRNHVGEPNEANLQNHGDGGEVGESDYDWWRQHYGLSLPLEGAGSLASLRSETQAIPEPATSLLILLGAIAIRVRDRSILGR